MVVQLVVDSGKAETVPTAFEAETAEEEERQGRPHSRLHPGGQFFLHTRNYLNACLLLAECINNFLSYRRWLWLRPCFPGDFQEGLF